METKQKRRPLVMILLLGCVGSNASASTYTVSSIAELNMRISGAVAGDLIILKKRWVNP